MFPPADDAPDLGIPPNGGHLPVRTNPRVRPGHQRNARPQGILGARARRGALCEILDVFFLFNFLCFVYSCSDDHAEQNRRDRAGVVVS